MHVYCSIYCTCMHIEFVEYLARLGPQDIEEQTCGGLQKGNSIQLYTCTLSPLATIAMAKNTA